jgi:hypothetical protein
MPLYIDQSGKIEDTARDTVLCLSNATWHAVAIKAATKRHLQELFRRNGQIRNFILFTFCAGLALLLKKAKPQSKVSIDEEYSGKNAIIKNILQSMLASLKSSIHIDFTHVGKQSPAHFIAGEIAKGRKRATWVLEADQLLRQIKKTEVGIRLKDA